MSTVTIDVERAINFKLSVLAHDKNSTFQPRCDLTLCVVFKTRLSFSSCQAMSDAIESRSQGPTSMLFDVKGYEKFFTGSV